MAFDEHLTERVLELVGDVDGVVELKMFGGWGITVHGNMAVGVMGDDLIARVGPAAFAAALAKAEARPFDFTGRVMTGWVYVDGAAISRKPALRAWVNRGVTFAQSLPPKVPRPRRRAAPGAGGRARRNGL